ncbi:hypothetical protein LNP25_23700 [Klebsiella variicola subsp. variicola]|nr:hypothetical protein [Klebsiella variicola subsp. variicola]
MSDRQERRAVGFHLEKDGVDTQALWWLSSLKAIRASFCCVMRLSGVLAIIDPTSGGQSKARHGGESSMPRTGSRCVWLGFDGGSVRCRDK